MKFSFAFFSRLSKREKVVFYATSFVVGILLADRLILQPIVHTLHSSHRELEDLESSIKKSMKLLSQKDRILKEVKEYASYSVQAKSAEEEMVGLLKFIEDLANESNVNLVYAKPAGEKEEGKIKKFLVNMECETQMQGLMNFFYKVEDSKQLLRIEKYTIQPSSPGSSVVKSAITISKTVVR